MVHYILRRLLLMIPGLMGIVFITFFLTRILPGDPAMMMAGMEAPISVIEKIRQDMGLNDPLYKQFIHYVMQLLHGDFGFAWHTGHTVWDDFSSKFPATLELTIASFIIALLIALPVGIIAATKKESIIDHVSRVFSLIGSCVPSFWLGLILIYVFYSKLNWVPAPLGRIGRDINPPSHVTGLYVIDSLLSGDFIALTQTLTHLLLPAFCLSTGTMAIISRMIRSSMLEVISQEFIRTARAKGIYERTVILKHAFVNALLPTLTVIGVQFGLLLGGAVVTETIFSWPGVGGYITESILATDYAPIQAFTLMSAVLISLTNLTVDVLYGLLDPRIRYE
ncbi:ABC transporter permease [Paenibacillus sp. FSL H7-0331]|uniref:ABC transporter permease n=1 Tax=Paenibacillus sp. FSL H7-0331 TaxID=1920421 RepID=UPI00096F8AC4|nr:ABC transporter permease [Paenibacillus sp. FSL H7-0331]OMF04295.1 peptide ABC transporter permease [Paenibacillus sp. FSL H7-0331]